MDLEDGRENSSEAVGKIYETNIETLEINALFLHIFQISRENFYHLNFG